jgi:branched-chain amino acid transport system ATP-binding protein
LARPPPILALEALSRAFGGQHVIDHLDMTVEAGEILGILGPNGAGKSTLFNLIGGVLPPSGGRILLDGRDIPVLKPWDRSRLGIGRTYQVPKPFAHMSVFENVLVAAVHGGKMSVACARREADAVLHRTGLAHRAEVTAGRLGLLDVKQLELAKAIAVRPRLLLLDEVAGGLTAAETEALVTTIHEVHAGGVTVVWIEHIIQTLLRLVTRLCVLFSGSILATGDPHGVLADARVRAAYVGS